MNGSEMASPHKHPVFEWITQLFCQVDLRFEAENLEAFNKNFENSKYIIFPKPVQGVPSCSEGDVLEGCSNLTYTFPKRTERCTDADIQDIHITPKLCKSPLVEHANGPKLVFFPDRPLSYTWKCIIHKCNLSSIGAAATLQFHRPDIFHYFSEKFTAVAIPFASFHTPPPAQ